MNVQLATQELYKAFHKLNETYYEGKLPEPMIVISNLAKQGYYGVFYSDKLWTTADGSIKKYEIGIAAEALNRPYLEIIQTLHHEMIHLYCRENGIKDTTKRGKYHTIKFKEEAEKRGMIYNGDPHPKIGYSAVRLTEEAKKVIEGFGLNEEAFKLARIVLTKKKKKREKLRYRCQCEDAPTIVTTKEIYGTCSLCESDYELVPSKTRKAGN